MATTISVVCPYCNNRMRASAEFIGRRGRCPACRKLVDITASTTGPSLDTIHPTQATGAKRAAAARLGSTTVPGWLSGIIGAVVAGAVYFSIFLPLESTYFGQLFLNRGLMPYLIVLVTCWGLAMLAMKYFAVKKQLSYAELELEFIPLDIGVQITPSNVDQFLGHLVNLPEDQRLSILGRRSQGALEHFKYRDSVPEVQEYLATQAEIDASSVDRGYTLLRAFIWALPILGFIGTVMGISDAVTGLSSSIGGGGGEQLMAGLGEVTAGLAIAFDTTLIALIMAIVLLFPTESLRKTEYAMLDRIEAFTNESLLRRLADERGTVDSEKLPQIVRDTLEAAFQEHQRWLAQWQAQVAKLGEVIGADLESAAARVQQQISSDDAARFEQIGIWNRSLQELFEKIEEATRTWHPREQDIEPQVRQSLNAAAQLQQALEGNLKLCTEIAQQQNRCWKVHSEDGVDEPVLRPKQQTGEGAGKWDRSNASPDDHPPETLVSIEPTPDPPSERRSLFGRLWRWRR